MQLWRYLLKRKSIVFDGQWGLDIWHSLCIHYTATTTPFDHRRRVQYIIQCGVLFRFFPFFLLLCPLEYYCLVSKKFRNPNEGTRSFQIIWLLYILYTHFVMCTFRTPPGSYVFYYIHTERMFFLQNSLRACYIISVQKNRLSRGIPI